MLTMASYARENIHKWLSPADPSTNHNIACGTHHKKPANWFFEGSIFREWKSKGSLIGINGKRALYPLSTPTLAPGRVFFGSSIFGSIRYGLLMSLVSSTIIEDIEALCEAGQASMAYSYFDFRNASKQGLRDSVPSLLTQLSARSSPRCDVLSDLYSVHDSRKKKPSDSVLTKCLKDILALPDQVRSTLSWTRLMSL
jgi:hypothetical protein